MPPPAVRPPKSLCIGVKNEIWWGCELKNCWDWTRRMERQQSPMKQGEGRTGEGRSGKMSMGMEGWARRCCWIQGLDAQSPGWSHLSSKGTSFKSRWWQSTLQVPLLLPCPWIYELSGCTGDSSVSELVSGSIRKSDKWQIYRVHFPKNLSAYKCFQFNQLFELDVASVFHRGWTT